MNIYAGQNNHHVCVNGEEWLNPRTDLINHSPDGFAWGYSGSGPSQLALAIMVNEFGEDLDSHPVHYQDFKSDVIANFKEPSFSISSTDIRDWIRSRGED